MFELPDVDRFNRQVWDIVRQIPRGQVATYGQIASMIPAPEGLPPEVFERLAPRWVGEAMNAVSSVDEPTVPWHRVINSKGGIAMSEQNPAAHTQRARLRAESVVFDAKEQVDFEVVGWDGPPADWIEAQGLLPPRSLKRPPDEPRQLSLF